MGVRGIRGAINVEANNREEISVATQRLLRDMVAANQIQHDQIISIFFTMTTDLNAAFPAAAARALGWTDIPLLDAQEMEVPGGMARVIRVLMHVETHRTLAQIQHVYLDAAAALRPDISQ
jgi:chorismate mutase